MCRTATTGSSVLGLQAKAKKREERGVFGTRSLVSPAVINESCWSVEMCALTLFLDAQKKTRSANNQASENVWNIKRSGEMRTIPVASSSNSTDREIGIGYCLGRKGCAEGEAFSFVRSISIFNPRGRLICGSHAPFQANWWEKFLNERNSSFAMVLEPWWWRWRRHRRAIDSRRHKKRVYEYGSLC